MINISGIYKIYNIINKKVYIGCSSNISKRWNQHQSSLRKNKHINYLLQEDWNVIGESKFKFEIIELIEDKDILFEREQYWINHYNTYDNQVGYNLLKEDINNNPIKLELKNKYIPRQYSKIFHDKWKEIILNKTLTQMDKTVFILLCGLITYPSNSIQLNGEILTVRQLSKLLNISDKPFGKSLINLENIQLIKRETLNGRHKIYINPNYCTSGRKIDNKTLKMFGLLDYDEEKVKEYIKEE